MMTNLRELKLTLVDWETRIILESITNEMRRLRTLADTSDNDDEAADAGNDYLQAAGLKERLEREAISVFGKQITNFSREEI